MLKMTMFDECREALGSSFYMVQKDSEKEAINILHVFPLVGGSISWTEIEHVDLFEPHEILNFSGLAEDMVYVLADDASIPLFATKISSFIENIYDVISLSPRIFIFNDKIIIQPLFPDDKIRLGFKKTSSLDNLHL